MSKKSKIKKERLGKQIKRSRRIPVLAMVRTHRRIQQNLFARNWRRTKLNLKGD
ncbi:50S ribosomal protein L39e [Candidatus Micrarchaeum sp.]|jgi:ribosomal protein L39E|uniref:50S ribosomal protein L39e n=1 Tax=Candidatus Micrarchaeum sp. TaxID=2282148 RepID=UPI000A69EC51|nr:50S ribosomal protein L39e [Candidatus Micrarchaeum sp.]QRF74463.1 50S ribosomal protein L39e [Candidatus Micrarchaeum sp.]